MWEGVSRKILGLAFSKNRVHVGRVSQKLIEFAFPRLFSLCKRSISFCLTMPKISYGGCFGSQKWLQKFFSEANGGITILIEKFDSQYRELSMEGPFGVLQNLALPKKEAVKVFKKMFRDDPKSASIREGSSGR